MITRQQFLQRLAALSATAALPSIYNFGCSPHKTSESDTSENLDILEFLTFDLHCHPGQFFRKGTEGYAGDDAVVKTVDEMNQGNLSGAFISMVSDTLVLQRTETGIVPARNFKPGEAWQDIQRQLAVIKELFQSLNAHWSLNVDDLPSSENPALFLACEGGDFMEDDLENIDRIYEAGIRSIQLVHYAPNKLGDLQTHDSIHNGLSNLGKTTVKRMNDLGIVIDVAHASFKTVKDIAEITNQPLILSHSILKMEDDRPIAARAITPDHAKVVAETGGVIGAWPSGFNKNFEDYIDNILRLIDVVGINHVGLGTDMDSNFRPVMNSYLQLSVLHQALQDKGLSKEEVNKLSGKNALRVLNKVFGG